MSAPTDARDVIVIGSPSGLRRDSTEVQTVVAAS